MSAEQPPRPETTPETPSTEHEPSPEEVIERNTVPPTPEAPQEQIDNVRERLQANQQPAAQPPQAPHTPTPAAAAQPGRLMRAAQWTKGMAKGVGLKLYGFFGYIFFKMFLQSLMRAGEMNTGGGGGGHAKPKGGGGGGHH